MRCLLDTHLFLWFILDDAQLSESAESAICERTNNVLVSQASYWKIAIRIGLGKYAIPEPFEPFIQTEIISNEFEILPILPKHAAMLIVMPPYHKDHFDRLLVAQAMAEHIPIVSADPKLDVYGVQRLW
jgi:PIN domain nuclease of toxin-antitoxin system